VDLAPDSQTITLLAVSFSGPELAIQSHLPANCPQTDGRGEAADHSRDLTDHCFLPGQCHVLMRLPGLCISPWQQ
jgi:hypothetical protein